jgi:hypothetical protein
MTITRYVPQPVLERAETIVWSIGLGAVTPEALAERNQVPIAVAHEHLDEAVRLEVMEKKSILVGYSTLYVPTSAGMKLARKHESAGGYAYPKGIRRCRISIKNARHTIACAGVAAALERRYPDHRICGELELRRDEQEQGSRLATVELQGRGERRSHSPDLVIWPPGALGKPAPLPVAVEVELTHKSKEEWTENLRAWARCTYLEAVLYYVETTKVEEKLLDVIEQIKAEEMIIVNPLSEILKPLTGFPLTDD